MRKLSIFHLLLWFLLPALLTITLIGCSQGDGVKPNAASNREKYFKTRVQDESQFVVELITADIAEMAYYAKHQAQPKVKAEIVTAEEITPISYGFPKYKLAVSLPGKSFDYTLEVTNNIWSPETYSAFTKAVFDSLELPASKTPAPSDLALLHSLLNLTATNIETQNKALSTALRSDFSNPVPHEKAAALLGTFALRENSGSFFDIRSPLSRMTAHLAFAKALASNRAYGPEGLVAQALLSTLSNNQRDALEQIKLLDQANPDLAAWSRAIHARNTHDFRPLAAVKDRSLLEQVEHFRAYAISANCNLAWEQLPDNLKIQQPDFCRIVNAREYSVQLGHVMSRLSLPLELREFTEVYQLSKGHALKAAEAITALNQMPGRCLSPMTNGTTEVQVIGWGQWATFFQHHICHAVVNNYDFLANKWGVPEAAREFSQKCDGIFQELRLYPFVRLYNCTDQSSHRASIDDCLTVTTTFPHLVPTRAWNQIYYDVPVAPHYQPKPPHVDEWHSHNPPPGTAYDPYPRLDHSNLVRQPNSVTRLELLHEIAPYDCDISYSLCRIKYKKNANYEQTEAIYRPILDYDGDLMYQLSKTLTNNPGAYETLLAKTAAIDPYRYYNLGEYFEHAGNEEKAANYYQKGMKACDDSISASYHASYLIKYYVKKGQIKQASELADSAAETYSSVGLQTKAEFLESTGNYLEALDYYKKIEERYKTSDELMHFCERYRAKTGKTDYDSVFESRVKSLFPNGIEHVALKDFTSAPTDGAVITSTNERTAQAGLKKGGIIVAVYGIRVHTFPQYSYARDTSKDPQLDLIVWQDNKYTQIKASPPEHRFLNEMHTYVSGR
ncbi:tetratricopeptide repeat protein [Pedosphaera parvula]|uniref:Tetratricopeptide domain protein n=1 Tax=Pedosphaera parvula (strain Ellin514) TaxID=320771 RepID=B9XC13_PEDPL|nr:tetratricopeptide repeat protein [Pedosphaera parvula]EEF62481.1 Tetratricopeptide domain protein [Pedosphaera parvula Ellin514]